LQVQDPVTQSYIFDRTQAFGDRIDVTTIADSRTAPGSVPAAAVNSYSDPGTDNKLASITQSATTVRSVAYDRAGNITSDTRGSTIYHSRDNKRNRLDELTIGATVTADYTYEGLERLAICASSAGAHDGRGARRSAACNARRRAPPRRRQWRRRRLRRAARGLHIRA
jgi:hypothetical protein